MMDSYFGGGLKYLCLTFQDNSVTCSAIESVAAAQLHERDSMLMNLIDAAAKISDVILWVYFNKNLLLIGWLH